MNSYDTRDESRAVARDSVKDLSARLAKAKGPAEIQAVTKEGLRRLDATTEAVLNRSGEKLACRAGCSFCCHIRVDATPYEVFNLLEHLRAKLSKDELESVHKKARASREQGRTLTLEEREDQLIPCPVLKDGRCLGYAARPAACRTHHSLSVAVCESVFKEPGNPAEIPVEPETRLYGAAVAVAMEALFHSQGYDRRPYDLPSALADALDNPACAKRWRDKKTAFPATSLTKDFHAHDASHMEIVESLGL